MCGVSSLVLGVALGPGLLSAPPAKAPSLAPLKAKLDGIAAGFQGRLGYHLMLMDSGVSIGYRDQERYPSASTIKTAVMVEAMNQVDEGKLKWTDKMEVPTDPSRRQASMWSYFLKDGTKLDLDGWVNLMITVSDNTATIVVRDWLGPQNVNRRMESLGLPNTKILGNLPPENVQDQRLRRSFGMGMTTPREMVGLFHRIHLRQAASPAACDKMLRILSHQYWDDFIGSSVPPDIRIACKSGAINRSRSDVAIVYGPTPYILAIFTDSQKDQRWVSGNEGDVAIRKMANLIWNHLHPQRPYSLPKGSEKFMPTGGGVE